MVGEDIRSYSYINHDIVIELRAKVRSLQAEIVRLNRRFVKEQRSKDQQQQIN